MGAAAGEVFVTRAQGTATAIARERAGPAP